MITRDPLLPLHIGLCVALLWLAHVLAQPGHTFGTGVGYAGLAAVASEEAWTRILAASGLFGLAGIWDLTWGNVAGVPLRWHLVCIAVLALVHLWLGLLVFLANPVGFGTPLFGVLGALGLVLLWHRVSHAR